MKIAPNPAVVAAQKYYQVPYAIGGVLKEVELINAQLRERRIKAGQFDDRQAAFASTHCIARTIIYS
jgi:hypothetical protein